MNKMNYGCEGLCVAISGGTSGIGLAAALRFFDGWCAGIYFGTLRGTRCAGFALSGGADRKAGSVYFL